MAIFIHQRTGKEGTTSLGLFPSLFKSLLCSGPCLFCFPDVALGGVEHRSRSAQLRFGSTWSREDFWVKCVLAPSVFPLCKRDGGGSRWHTAGLCCLPGGCSLTLHAEVYAIPVRGCCLSCLCHWSTVKPGPNLWVQISPWGEG